MALKNRKKVAPSDLSHLLQNSMLTGIPQIAAAGNWQKKIVRSAVFVLCVGGFIYQTFSFMDVYWRYETVVDVQVYNPLMVEKPAYTVCGQWGFKGTTFCTDPDEDFKEKHDIMCEKIEENEYYDWCACLPRLCTETGQMRNISVMETQSYVKLRSKPWDEVKPWMAKEEDYIEYCTETKLYPDADVAYCVKNDYKLEIPCPFGQIAAESCFTRNSIINRPNGTIQTVRSTGDMWLTLNQLEDEVPTSVKSSKLFISFHNPYQILNPMKDGFILESGMRYYFKLSKVIKKLLPYPYETNCIDYLSLWKARGGRGPTNIKECLQECHRNLSMERHGCLLHGINYPGFDQRCEFGKTDTHLVSDSEDCVAKNCKPACYEEYYVIQTDVTENSEEFSCYRDDYKTKPIESDVILLLNGMETTVYSYSPKYQDIETFSYVGGYIGMWLGISLIAVFDFLETMVTLLKYPLRRMRYCRAKNKVGRFEAGQRSLY